MATQILVPSQRDTAKQNMAASLATDGSSWRAASSR
jgi:hypothetical protein